MGLSSIFVMGNSLLLQLEGSSHMPAADTPPEKQRSPKPLQAPMKAAKGIIKSVNPASHVSSLWQSAVASAAGIVRP